MVSKGSSAIVWFGSACGVSGCGVKTLKAGEVAIKLVSDIFR
jgi:hypothetical protein